MSRGSRSQRLLDVLGAAAAAPVWVPVGVVVALLVRVIDGSPVLFRQRRVGLGGQEFDILKFRTIRVSQVERFGPPVAADVTRMGRVLRRTSLDEVPQLLNVLRGDMSLVGPRPVRPEHLQRSSLFAGARLDVRPGLTGLAQVSGRNALTWADKIELDVKYARERSLLLDVRILVRTVRLVATGSMVDHDGIDPLGTGPVDATDPG